MIHWHLKGEPRLVQRAALEAADKKKGFAYFKEMGLGKTATLLNDFVGLLIEKKVEHLVIVCPNSLKSNWRDEVEKWGVDIDVVLWPKKPKFVYENGKQTYKLERSTMWVFNYESMLFAGGEEVSNFLQTNKCMFALDESSRIKNFNAKTTKHMIAMSQFATYTRLLTGTPMTQSVMDLWSQLRFIGELQGVNPYVFRNRHAIMGGFMGKQVIGVQNEESLQALLKRCSFQAKKVDWWKDCPKKQYTLRSVEMTKIQMDAYNEMKRNFLLMLSDATVVTAQMVITQLSKLQQISRGFIYDDDGNAQELVTANSNPAISIIHEVLDEIEGKLIVAAVHRYSVSALYAALAKYNVARIQGGMEDDEVDAEKHKFNNDPTCRVIINQMGVGSMGHTLIGKPGKERCSTMLVYENTFSLEKRKQMEDRNHRDGQDQDCMYIDLYTSPVDKRAVQALQRKEDVVASVMDGAKSQLFI